MSRHVQVMLATVALMALVACTGAAGGPGVATLDSPDPSGSQGSSPAPSAVSPADAALAYARCMREHGVDMPDPQVETSANGEVKIDQRGGAPVSKEKMEAADTACQHFLAAAGANGPAQQMSAEDQDKVLAFAKCMREHGVDMPDPDFSGGGVRIQVGTGTKNEASGAKGGPDDPDFQAAQEACGSLLPGKMGKPGFNSGGDTKGADSSPVNQ